MQSWIVPTPAPNEAAPFPISRSGSITRSKSSTSVGNPNANSSSDTTTATQAATARRRPSTSHGDRDEAQERPPGPPKDRDRRPSFSGLARRASFSSSAKGKRRPSNSSVSGVQPRADGDNPPALPDFAAATAAKYTKEYENAKDSPASVDSFSRMLSRTAPTSNGHHPATTPPLPNDGRPSISTQGGLAPPLPSQSQPEGSVVYQHIQEIANKRISTLDYLRKAYVPTHSLGGLRPPCWVVNAPLRLRSESCTDKRVDSHEGRVYWFNTLLFDKPDLARMPYFDSRKLARRATNYLLLGLSLPTVIDLNSSNAVEFLRSLNTLLTEFDSFQQIHNENGVNSSSLSRARLPQMFRRPGYKGRRTSGAGDLGILPENERNGSIAGPSAMNQTPTSVISFGMGGEGNDLLPGEEYTHLLTPSLPFDPDFFETFATLCDVLIDCYTRLMSLIPNAKECTPPIAELFTKADSKVRKIIIQGVVKEFEDSSRVGLKQEVGSVGKIVLGGLM